MPNINIDDAYILGETGAQVDKVTGLFTKDEGTTSGEKAFAQLNIGTAGSNRNLLDNPFFTVRQRGNGPFTAPNYTADRWKLTAGSAQLSFDDNGGVITPNGSYLLLTQYTRIPSNIGTVTASIKIGGTVYSVTGNAATGFQLSLADVWGSGRIEVAVSGGYLNFIIGASTAATFEAVKLELGSVSTLANDVPPDYGTEFLKCARYFLRIKYTNNRYPRIGTGVTLSTSNAAILIPTPVPMRATTITVSYSGSFAVISVGSSGNLVSAMSYVDHTAAGVSINCALSDSVFTPFYGCMLQGQGSANGYIDLSADL